MEPEERSRDTAGYVFSIPPVFITAGTNEGFLKMQEMIYGGFGSCCAEHTAPDTTAIGQTNAKVGFLAMRRHGEWFYFFRGHWNFFPFVFIVCIPAGGRCRTDIVSPP